MSLCPAAMDTGVSRARKKSARAVAPRPQQTLRDGTTWHQREPPPTRQASENQSPVWLRVGKIGMVAAPVGAVLPLGGPGKTLVSVPTQRQDRWWRWW